MLLLKYVTCKKKYNSLAANLDISETVISYIRILQQQPVFDTQYSENAWFFVTY